MGICGIMRVRAHLSYIPKSQMWAGGALSQPLALQRPVCLWSIHAQLQAGAADREGCCGPALHLKRLKALQPVSMEGPQVHTCLLHDPDRRVVRSQPLKLMHGG